MCTFADSSQTAANGGMILKLTGTQSDVVFGNVPQGVPSNSMRVTLLNAGTGTIEIGGGVMSGANKADFTLGDECELQLPPAGSCNLSATFTPSLMTAETATLTLTAQIQGGNPTALTVQFSGTGGAQQQAAAPTFNPAAGTYSSAQTVTISSTTPNAVLYYTTDGSAPTAASSQFSAPIQVAASEILNAIATAPGYSASTIAAAAYTIGVNTNGGFTLGGQVVTSATFTPSPTAWANNPRQHIQQGIGHHKPGQPFGPGASVDVTGWI